ncbi:MAG: hypothetical protein IKN72_06480 [Clostridia bacterium]|nr:hypothetical protein [Clostridia bacterium]
MPTDDAQLAGTNPLQTLLSLDGDSALLLGLLLLLRREGADDALLLALLYIML